MADKTLSLTDAPRALAAYGTPPSYQQLWKAVVAGRVPAEKVGKRWMIRTDDLEIVAKALCV